jgi:hypothetical protein
MTLLLYGSSYMTLILYGSRSLTTIADVHIAFCIFFVISLMIATVIKRNMSLVLYVKWKCLYTEYICIYCYVVNTMEMNHLQILRGKSPDSLISVFSGSKPPKAQISPLAVLCNTPDTAGYSNIHKHKFFPHSRHVILSSEWFWQ